MAGKKRKLNYIFYNPNTPEATADFLLKLFIEVNADKVDRVIRAALAREEGARLELPAEGD